MTAILENVVVLLLLAVVYFFSSLDSDTINVHDYYKIQEKVSYHIRFLKFPFFYFTENFKPLKLI